MSFEFDKKRQSKLLADTRLKKVERAERTGGSADARSLLLSVPEILRRIQKLDIPDEDKVVLAFLEKGLDEWASGVQIDVALCIKKETGAPKVNRIEPLLEYALPVSNHLDQGETVDEALAKVAKVEGVSERTVARAWKLAGGLEGYLRRKQTDKK